MFIIVFYYTSIISRRHISPFQPVAKSRIFFKGQMHNWFIQGVIDLLCLYGRTISFNWDIKLITWPIMSHYNVGINKVFISFQTHFLKVESNNNVIMYVFVTLDQIIDTVSDMVMLQRFFDDDYRRYQKLKFPWIFVCKMLSKHFPRFGFISCHTKLVVRWHVDLIFFCGLPYFLFSLDII